MSGYNLSYATLPEARRKMANKVRALNLMMKMIATRVPDLNQWEQNRDHPLIANGMLAQDNPDWLATAERQNCQTCWFRTISEAIMDGNNGRDRERSLATPAA